MKRLTAVASVALSASLLTGVALVPAAPAAARAPYVDVLKLSAPNTQVSSTACKTVAVSLKKKTNTRYWDVHTRMYKGTKRLPIYYPDGFNTNIISFVSGFAGSTKQKIRICPRTTGLGKITLGPSQVNAVTGEWGTPKMKMDRTKGYFYVRSAVRTTLKAKRSGNSVSVVASSRRFSPDGRRPGYIAYSPKAELQIRSGSTWRKIRSVTLKRGTAHVTVEAKKSAEFRIVIGRTQTAASSTAKVRS